MPNDGHNALEGMGELLLSLVRKNCTSLQWASWLQLTLQGAASGGDAEMVFALLKAGAPSYGIRPADDLTPLHSAALGGSLDVVSSLLKTSATYDVNKTTLATKRTPLYFAVQYGHADVALALARAGGDVNLADSRGLSPLMRAADDGRAELVTNLLLRDSRVDAKDNRGNQALHYAVRRGHLGVIRVLLQGEACPGKRSKDEMSPVDCAVRRENTDALFELLSSAPNLNILDDSGKSAMFTAVETGKPEVIGMLADAGMDVDSPIDSPIDDDGSLPLHVACYYLQPSSVQALLRLNADETIRDGSNELPHAIVGNNAFVDEEEENDAVVEDIRKMLARAPADRVWRRRGWLAMLKARKRATDKEHRKIYHEGGTGNDQRDEAEPPSALSSRRKLADGRKWTTGDAVHVHQTRKKFHWAVTKMVDVADELVFRNIVSYL